MLGLGELKQTRVYQEAQQEEALAFLLRLVTRRFGKLEVAVQAQLQSLSTAQLEELGEDLLDFATVNDLLTWLQAHAGGSANESTIA